MSAVIGEVVLQFWDDGQVTNTGFRAEEAAQHARAIQVVTDVVPGSTVIQDPWSNQQAQQAPRAQPAHPSCSHGPLKAVPGGISGPNSRNPGTPYAAFWACPAAQGVPKCRLDRNQLPPVPA